MKIGIICYPTLGGSGVVATELGHALALRGHDIHFIAYEIPFRLNLEEKHVYFHKVEINPYDLFKYPDYALPLAVKIAEVSHEYKLDILHVHYAIPHATSAYLAKQLNGPNSPAIITTLHGTDITLVGRDPSYYSIVKFSIEQSTGITAVSKSLRNQTIEYFDIKKDIEIIHNFFIPQPKLIGKKSLRNRMVAPDEKLLIHASNFRALKRPQDVLNIFIRIRKKIQSKLALVGTGPEIENIQQMVKEYKLEHDVLFIGKRSLIDPYVACADLFLLPSSHESFGLAALEAMAYGVPVIASDVGGLPEVIIHGKTGYLAPMGDVTTMANFAIELLKDDKLYQQMSKASQERAKKDFSVDKILPQYESFYKKIIG